MYVTMFNVGFGESILYKESKQKLLVDWGSVTNRNMFLPGYTEIVKELNPDTALMITHFEEDHFNGILEYHFPDDFKFREIIIPKYLNKDSEIISGTEAVFADTLRIWAYGMTTNYDKLPPLHRLFCLLPSLVNTVSDIKAMSYGDSVFVDQTCLDILWPQEKNNMPYDEYVEEVKSILQKGTEGDALLRERLDTFLEHADRYVDTFLKVYSLYICKDGENLLPELEKLKKKYKMMTQSIVKLNLSDEANDRLNDIHSIRVKSINDSSIVFQSRYNRDVLALGDVSSKILNYLQANRLVTDQYNVVKVQHHGSKAYWSDNLPTAKWYLISNSGWAYMKWRIYEKYGSDYMEGILCTNDREKRCSYYDGKAGKKCQSCQVSASGNEPIKSVEVDTVTLERKIIVFS